MQRFTAEQDLGPYPICICGVPGAYYVEAFEHDDIGLFSTLEEARSEVDFHYGEFITGTRPC